MKTTSFSAMTLLLLCPLLLMACAQQAPTRSGFLADYADLRPLETDANLQAMALPGSTPWAPVHIEPVRFISDESGRALPDAERKALCSVLEEALTKEFAGLAPTDQQISRSLRINAAITGVDRSRPLLNLFTALAIFVPMDNGGVSVEIEAIEVDSGRRIAALSGARNGSLFALSGYFKRYGHAEAGLKQLAQEFHRLLLTGPNVPAQLAHR